MGYAFYPCRFLLCSRKGLWGPVAIQKGEGRRWVFHKALFNSN